MASYETSQDETTGGYPSSSDALANISDEGDVPSSRFRDAKSANSWAVSAWQADYMAALDRSSIDDLIDGAPPMNQADLRNQGQGNSFNINFNRAFAKVEQALASYNDLANADEDLIRCEIDTDLGSPAQREEWAQIYARGYTRLMRYDWDDYQNRMLMLENQFIRQGVAITFRPNEWDWRWDVSRLGDFQISRRDGCGVSDLECACQRTFETPPNVYDWIRNRDAAEKVGWNYSATMKAIEGATVIVGPGPESYNWEQVQRDMKDNGAYMTRGKDKRVELRHFWTKEFSGKISHYITSPDNNDDFLFVKRNRWNSPSECMTFFTYGIGNGDFYSIRGLGYKIFALEQMFNILMSRLGDSTLRSTSYLWQPSSADSLADTNQIIWGADALVPQGLAPVQQFAQNVGQNALQILNMLSNIEGINTGTYTASQQLLPGGQPDRKSATQASIEAQQEAILTTSAKVLFYQALDRLDQMTVKALNKRVYPRNMPGGELRWKLLRYCLDRGMPEEAFYNVTCVRHVRSIGMGSPAQEQQKLGAIMALFPMLDPIAQKLIIRQQVVKNLGPDYADAYAPLQPRVPRDKKDAELESSLFIDGIQPEIMPEEQPDVHLSEHVPFAANVFEALSQGDMDPKEAIKRLSAAIPHIQQTYELLQQNPTKKKEIQQYQQVIAQLVADTEKLFQNYSAEEQARQEAIAQEQQNLTAEELKQQRENLKAQSQIEREQYKTDAQIEMDRYKTEQSVRQKAAKTGSDIASQSVLTEQQVSDNARKTRQSLAISDIKTAQDLANSQEETKGS